VGCARWVVLGGLFLVSRSPEWVLQYGVSLHLRVRRTCECLLHCVEGVLQCVAVCCRLIVGDAMVIIVCCRMVCHCICVSDMLHAYLLQCVAGVLQCVAECCRCVAMRCRYCRWINVMVIIVCCIMVSHCICVCDMLHAYLLQCVAVCCRRSVSGVPVTSMCCSSDVSLHLRV